MPEDLGDFTAPDRLKNLVNLLTENGKNNERFENFALLNTSKFVLEGGFPKEYMRYYAYPSTNPVYLFIVEIHPAKFPHVHVRTPSNGHDTQLLECSLKAILFALHSELKNHDEFLLEADTTVREVFFKLQREGASFETLYWGDFLPFYMNAKQKKDIVQEEFTVPKGYVISSINVPDEYEFIHKMWPFAGATPDSVTRERLENLPSVCTRDSDGQLASWELTHSLGAVTHLFTVEEHRGKGLGVLAENLLAQIYVKEGLHVYKYVVDSNVDVIRGTERHPYWSRWKIHDENNGEKEMMWSFNSFKYTG
ncbi:hypothetical protein PRIPAC_79083 [Pristionchus pacificus]|uniref:Glycine N-acyltransferase-like protein n=1 Tax=Pristionchus pacificus TaxID=54126 RepID=A0A2A6CMI0_PRIPA|nr:hypothetical protein PRIPAC_79083 [Pristionchus pacificus]|eukprot:PDM79300.1 hypothetical protein PRIPAC_31879 [Pristionchus pacificus]